MSLLQQYWLIATPTEGREGETEKPQRPLACLDLAHVDISPWSSRPSLSDLTSPRGPAQNHSSIAADATRDRLNSQTQARGLSKNFPFRIPHLKVNGTVLTE